MAFNETFAQVQDAVRQVFPQAEEIEDWGMRGWRVELENPPPPNPKATASITHLIILLADRKAGPALHIWYPRDYYWLDGHKDELTAAGFTVMRGCLPYNKKRPYPIETIEKLLRTIEL